MRNCDFIVKHDFEKESQEELIKKIFYHAFYRPLKQNFPVILFIGGKSGHGKSYMSSKIIELICNHIGLNYENFFEAVNVFHPLEYMEKFEKITMSKEMKKVSFFCIHESRLLMSAKLWYSFVNQNIAHMNALTRGVKPLLTIIISQNLKDVDKDLRRTLTYYCTVQRKKGGNEKVKLRINVIYDDERDPENIKMRRRRLQGFVIDEKGKYRRFCPSDIELRAPSREIRNLIKKYDTMEKRKILLQKITETHEAIKKDVSIFTKTDKLVTYYSTRKEELFNHVKIDKKGNYKMNKDFIIMHDLERKELKDFEIKIKEKIGATLK